jgi:hypothetical protein
MLRIKRFAFAGMLLISTTCFPAKEQNDSTTQLQTEQISDTKPELKPVQEKKRQNKTEKLVFVSCLFIVLTTILLYNVRSK